MLDGPPPENEREFLIQIYATTRSIYGTVNALMAKVNVLDARIKIIEDWRTALGNDCNQHDRKIAGLEKDRNVLRGILAVLALGAGTTWAKVQGWLF